MLGKVEGQGVMRGGRTFRGGSARGCVWPAASSAAPRPQGACAERGARGRAPRRERPGVCESLGSEARSHGWSAGLSVCPSSVCLHLTSFHKGFKVGRAAWWQQLVVLSLFKTSLKLFSEEEFLPLDPTQELIFPPELMVSKAKLNSCQRNSWWNVKKDICYGSSWKLIGK